MYVTCEGKKPTKGEKPKADGKWWLTVKCENVIRKTEIKHEMTIFGAAAGGGPGVAPDWDFREDDAYAYESAGEGKCSKWFKDYGCELKVKCDKNVTAPAIDGTVWRRIALRQKRPERWSYAWSYGYEIVRPGTTQCWYYIECTKTAAGKLQSTYDCPGKSKAITVEAGPKKK